MSPLDSWLFIAAAVALVWCLWLFANRVADAWRGLVEPSTEDGGKPREERGS